MTQSLLDLGQMHSLPFVAGAMLICATTAWLLLVLLERASTHGGLHRLVWMGGVAAVAGMGVWTTHFIAVLGYRPDIAFVYDADTTLVSALVGAGLIGLPAAACALSRSRLLRVPLGMLSGIGVAAMHFTGMNALQGCVVTHSSATYAVAGLLGTVLFGAAFALRPRRFAGSASLVLIVAAVAAVHVVGIGGLSLEAATLAEGAGVDGFTIGVFTAGTALALFLAGSVCAVSSMRLEAQELQAGLLSTALGNMSNGLVFIDGKGRIKLFNDRLKALFGLDETELRLGMHWHEYLEHIGASDGWDAERLQRVIANHDDWFAKAQSTYLEHDREDGRVISVACRPVAGGGAVLTYDDVTAERRAQREIERLAFRDSLTGLANRRAFQAAVAEALETPGDRSLFVVDLDRFKSINDTLGHAVGDALLVEVGRRLLGACENPRDLVARLGGDEMAILRPAADPASDERLAERLGATFREPLHVCGHLIDVGCSIGIATTRDTQDAARLAQFADLALFAAKAGGRGTSRRYEAGMSELAARRQELEADLRIAIAERQFALVYQPLYSIAERRIFGFEALIRWTHPRKGAISPAEFIPVAEDTGLICPIGDWVIGEACRAAAHWPRDVHVAVNVSPVQLKSSRILGHVTQALAANGLLPGRLEIELTETALVEDQESIAMALSAFRALGVRVAMDDFGTGYSSFAHLRDFGLDRIKIDRSFVQAAPRDKAALAILRGVVQVARDLGVRTIGEGVETAEQLDLLARTGCDAAQGYFIDRPMSGAAARSLVSGEAPAPATPEMRRA
ncbi:EAL domain-containing protein [Aurantimonas sp. Leaf443]|uniref:bifunctional diguanylate cyclase/phosphodiesterase n=1 Tax=Aurantimonas sp. Leaf443 TaxID=1736378 RepID=UPI0006FDFB13|nr:EAL domain-containing protein [Aurantimonas sp. Leaf443]KQT85757.1 hypothetical protein ASG48_03810 [Aurantimonas sp. Leaf443]